MRMEEDDHTSMRVCMVGDAQVGKTSFVSQFLPSECMKDFDASLGGPWAVLKTRYLSISFTVAA